MNPTPSPSDATASARREARLEHDMELLVGYILLAGVLISIAFLVIGLVWQYALTGSLHLNYLIAGMNYFDFLLRDLRSLFHPAGWDPRIFIDLGIASLLFTPYIRVVSSMVFFAVEERNWKYTAFTAFVGAVLTYSLFLR